MEHLKLCNVYLALLFTFLAHILLEIIHVKNETHPPAFKGQKKKKTLLFRALIWLWSQENDYQSTLLWSQKRKSNTKINKNF